MKEKSINIKKIIKISILSIFYIIIGLLLLFSIATLSVKKEDDIPNLFGHGFLAVNPKATSMVGDNKDSFNPNDLIFVKVLSKKEKEKLDLNKLYLDNVVISFYDHNIKAINTHRVIEYDEKSGLIRTQGDNLNEPDNFYLSKEDVVAIYKSKAKGLGKPIHFMQTPLGFGLIVVLPTLLLLIYQGYVLIKNIYVVKEEKLKESLIQDKELEKERIRQELLKELEEEKKKESES